jgi:hypothetical protein
LHIAAGVQQGSFNKDHVLEGPLKITLTCTVGVIKNAPLLKKCSELWAIFSDILMGYFSTFFLFFVIIG